MFSHPPNRRSLATCLSECRWITVLVCKVLLCKMNLLTLWPWPLTFEPQNSTTSRDPKVTPYTKFSLWDHSFLRVSAMLKHVLAIPILPVRLSVTRWYCIKTAEIIVMLSSPHDSPFILVLCLSRSSRNFDRVTPYGAAKRRWGMKMSQFSTNNLLYLRNG